MVKFGLNVFFILLVYTFQTIFIITICHAEHKFVRVNNNELQACLSSSLPLLVRTIYPCNTSTNQNSSQYQCDHFNVNMLSSGGRIPHSPAVVVHVTDSIDVQTVVKCATKLNYTVNPFGAGHSYEGYGLGSTHNNIIISMAEINYINIDKSGRTARIGAGARLGPIYYRTYQSDNYTINAGDCITVGIAGQALGGGAGYLSRLHGLLADNILEMKGVNAEGELLTINETHESELYWALRGAGGGLFVIVTEFQFQLVQSPSVVTKFRSRWNNNATKLVIQRYQSLLFNDTTWNSNNNIYLVMDVRSAYVDIIMTNYGTELEGFNRIVSLFLTTLPHPNEMNILTQDWLTFVNGNENHSQLLLHNLTRRINYFKGKHLFYDQPISDYSLDQFLERLALRDGGFAMEFIPCDGHLNTIPVDKTAFPYRRYKFGIQFMAFSSSQQLDVQELNWLNQVYLAVYNDSTKHSYINYIDRDEPNWMDAYYDTHQQRLMNIKRIYDKNNRFYFERTIQSSEANQHKLFNFHHLIFLVFVFFIA